MSNNPKFKVAILAGVATISLILGIVGYRYFQDYLCAKRYEAAQKELSQTWAGRGRKDFSTSEADDLVEAELLADLPPLSSYHAEAYRVLILRTGRSGVITIVLGDFPFWDEIVWDMAPTRRSGKIGRFSKWRIRSILERSSFWTLKNYWSAHGADGEDWYFCGFQDGRYRRISEFSPTWRYRTYLYSLVEEVVSITGSDLIRIKRLSLPHPNSSNKSLDPTTTAVTPPAGQEARHQ